MPNDKECKSKPQPFNIHQRRDQDEVPWFTEEQARGAKFPFSGLVVAFALLTVGAFFASPYYKLFTLRQSLENGGVEALSQSVDFGAIKNQLINEAVGLGGENAISNVDRVKAFLEQNLNAEGVSSIYQQGVGDRAQIPVLQKSFGDFPHNQANVIRYKNLDTVVVEMDDGVVLFLERVGVFDWRIFRVGFPEA